MKEAECERKKKFTKKRKTYIDKNTGNENSGKSSNNSSRKCVNKGRSDEDEISSFISLDCYTPIPDCSDNEKKKKLTKKLKQYDEKEVKSENNRKEKKRKATVKEGEKEVKHNSNGNRSNENDKQAHQNISLKERPPSGRSGNKAKPSSARPVSGRPQSGVNRKSIPSRKDSLLVMQAATSSDDVMYGKDIDDELEKYMEMSIKPKAKPIQSNTNEGGKNENIEKDEDNNVKPLSPKKSSAAYSTKTSFHKSVFTDQREETGLNGLPLTENEGSDEELKVLMTHLHGDTDDHITTSPPVIRTSPGTENSDDSDETEYSAKEPPKNLESSEDFMRFFQLVTPVIYSESEYDDADSKKEDETSVVMTPVVDERVNHTDNEDAIISPGASVVNGEEDEGHRSATPEADFIIDETTENVDVVKDDDSGKPLNDGENVEDEDDKENVDEADDDKENVDEADETNKVESGVSPAINDPFEDEDENENDEEKAINSGEEKTDEVKEIENNNEDGEYTTLDLNEEEEEEELPPVVVKPKWHPPWQLKQEIIAHTDAIPVLQIDPSNRWFATGSADKTVRIWDINTGRQKLMIKAHKQGVRAMTFGMTGHRQLFTTGDDRQLLCHDVEVNRIVSKYNGNSSVIYAMCTYQPSSLLITADRDKLVKVYDTRTTKCVKTLRGHQNTVACALVCEDTRQIVSGSHDSTLRVWDIGEGKCNDILQGHLKSVRDVTLHPDGRTILSASSERILAWKLPSGDCFQEIHADGIAINSITINHLGVTVAGGSNGIINLWDFNSGHKFQKISRTKVYESQEIPICIFNTKFDHTGAKLICSDACNVVKIYREAYTKVKPLTERKVANNAV